MRYCLKEFYSFQAHLLSRRRSYLSYSRNLKYIPEEIFEKLEDNEFVEAARIFWNNVLLVSKFQFLLSNIAALIRISHKIIKLSF